MRSGASARPCRPGTSEPLVEHKASGCSDRHVPGGHRAPRGAYPSARVGKPHAGRHLPLQVSRRRRTSDGYSLVCSTHLSAIRSAQGVPRVDHPLWSWWMRGSVRDSRHRCRVARSPRPSRTRLPLNAATGARVEVGGAVGSVSRLVRAWLEQQDGHIAVAALPPYAPELNPVEAI